MGRKSVAVLDVRSSHLTLVVGERGVNNTFVFRAIKTVTYDGYHDGKFFNEKQLADVLYRVVSSVEQVCGERIRELYVGVPGEFTDTVLNTQEISFSKKRKISEGDVEALFKSGREELKGSTYIRTGSSYFTTADNRRTVDPVGLVSSSLSGLLSYFYCTKYFTETMEKIFGEMRITLRYLPTQFAMATYLIPSETRDEFALFLDAGFSSSTLMIMQGGGVRAQSTYAVGRAQIEFGLMENFSLPYEAAAALLHRTNLYTSVRSGKTEFTHMNQVYEVDTGELIDTVKEGLDYLCEAIGGFLEENPFRELDYKPLYISGDGIADIRGAREHISKRANRMCECIAPELPYYNKPSMSSYIALMNMACGDRERRGFFSNLFGG